MKRILYILTTALLISFATSCEYDNYDEPTVQFQGSLLCNGEPFYYDGNPARHLLKVYQEGFGKEDIGTVMRTNEKGAYSAMLFAGKYELTLNNAKYPFSIEGFDYIDSSEGYTREELKLKKSIKRDFEVTPYWLINNVTLTEESGKIVARFDVEKNSESLVNANISRLRLYVGTASIVNSRSVCTVSKDAVITGATPSLEISVPLSEYRSKYTNNYRTYAFCRVAVELDGIPNYYLFSETIKIENLTDIIK